MHVFIIVLICALLLCLGVLVCSRNKENADGGASGENKGRRFVRIASAPASGVAADDSVPEKGPEGEVGDKKAKAQVPDSVAEFGAAVNESVIRTQEMRDAVDSMKKEILAAITEYEKSSADDKSLNKLVNRLSGQNRMAFLATLNEMMRIGDSREKTVALTALSAVYGDPNSPEQQKDRQIREESAPADVERQVSGSKDPELEAEMRTKNAALESQAAQNDTSREDEAMKTKLLVETVSSGLQDTDPEVRDAAFETMFSVPDEERGVLAAQILSGDNQPLKEKLLSAIKGSDDPTDIKINLQAMSGDDQGMRQSASDNIEKISGQRFETAEDAAQWLNSAGGQGKE